MKLLYSLKDQRTHAEKEGIDYSRLAVAVLAASYDMDPRELASLSDDDLYELLLKIQYDWIESEHDQNATLVIDYLADENGVLLGHDYHATVASYYLNTEGNLVLLATDGNEILVTE